MDDKQIDDILGKIKKQIDAEHSELDLEGNDGEYVKKAMWVGARIAGNNIVKSKVRDKAIDVVNMFDQANTNKSVCKLGSRGQLLNDAISDLRQALNANKQVTILSEGDVR